MRVAGVILLFAALAALDLPKIWKQQNRKELLVYSMILGGALIISLLHTLRIEMIRPNEVISAVVNVVIP